MGEVLLGMPGPWAKDYCESADHYTTKIGGLPDWPIEEVDVGSDLLDCGLCGRSLCLLLQLYAPMSCDTLKIEERTVYVFGCIELECGISPLSWRAFRLQKTCNLEESTSVVPEDARSETTSEPVQHRNSWLDKDSWINDSAEEDDFIDNEDVDLEELGRALSEAASLASNSKKQNGHKKLEPNAKVLPIRTPTGRDSKRPVVPCFYIYSQEESCSGSVNAVCSKYSSLSIKEGQSNLDDHKEEAWDEEGYEYDRALFVDRTYLKFKKRMDAFPEQCFRYSFGGKPLLATRDLEEPLNCGLCGAPRHYEVQLMPPVLFFLREASDGSSTQSPDEWNWMTLFVYTCSKSCSEPLPQGKSSGNSWTVAEEAVVVQFEKPLHGSARLSYLS